MQFRKGEFDMSTLDQDKIYTSKSLQEEMNAERMLEGKEPLPAINPLRGGTGTLARKDRSWKSVPDFFGENGSAKFFGAGIIGQKPTVFCRNFLKNIV